MAALLKTIEDALVARLQTVKKTNGYLTDAGNHVHAGFVLDNSGRYINQQVTGKSYAVEPGTLRRRKGVPTGTGTLTVTVFGLTNKNSTADLYELEEDASRALEAADFHPKVKSVEVQEARLGGGDDGELYGIAIPVVIGFTYGA